MLVIRPHNGSWYRDSVGHRDFGQRLLAFFEAERDELRAIEHRSIVRLLGGCWDASHPERTALVVEQVETWPALVRDNRLGLRQRLRLARSAVDLLRLFDAFPVRRTGASLHGDDGNDDDDDDSAHSVAVHSGRSAVPASASSAPVIFVESGGRSFGATSNYTVKLFALAGQLRFRREHGAYGDDVVCSADSECHAHFFSGRATFAALRDQAPLDFDCNLSSRRCWGLDQRTNLYMLCRTMLRPLFALNGAASKDVPAALAADRQKFSRVLGNVQKLLFHCEANNPNDRLTPEMLYFGLNDAEHQVARDAGEAEARPFELRNPELTGYVSLQELGHAALTAGALEAAERIANVSRDVANKLPHGGHERQQWLKEHLEPETDLGGSLDSHGRWHAHADLYHPPIVLTNWYFRLTLLPRWTDEADKPPARLVGEAEGQSWLSSPIRHW